VDFNARQQTFYEISKMIYDKVYWLGLWQDPDWFGISGFASNPRGLDVQLVDDGFQPEVGLRDRRAAEGVGLNDVGARVQVRVMDR
jgi:hypothetical protein